MSTPPPGKRNETIPKEDVDSNVWRITIEYPYRVHLHSGVVFRCGGNYWRDGIKLTCLYRALEFGS